MSCANGRSKVRGSERKIRFPTGHLEGKGPDSRFVLKRVGMRKCGVQPVVRAVRAQSRAARAGSRTVSGLSGVCEFRAPGCSASTVSDLSGACKLKPNPAHFTLRRKSLYRTSPASAGYGDKLRCAIGTADPGAVPGGSTKILAPAGVLTGPNQDRRVLKSTVFARAE